MLSKPATLPFDAIIIGILSSPSTMDPRNNNSA